MSNIQAELRLKGQVVYDDIIVMYMGEWMLLKPGDTYIAQHENEDPEVLTVRRVEVQKRNSGLATGKVFPKERKKKLYDLHEVVRVSIVPNPNPPQPKEQKNAEQPIESGLNVEASPESGGNPTPRANYGRAREAGRVDYTKPAADVQSVRRDPKRLP